MPTTASYSKSSNYLPRLSLQVYAASIMFGYFLRQVDKRFQLETALGMLDNSSSSQEEAVARLERLFAQVQ